jgi:hypothetical protein
MMIRLALGFVAAALTFGAPETSAYAQATSPLASSSAPQTSYLYVEETRAYSKFYPRPEEFQNVVSNIREYLAANRVEVVETSDAVGVAGNLPLLAVQDIAWDAGASYLLYLVADRPTMKWIKVTVKCYDHDGKELWKEEAGVSGGLTGKNAVRDTLLKLRTALDHRLGQAGLFQSDAAVKALEPAAPADASAAPTDNHNESATTLKLANGTRLRLLVSERVSSKTAETGSTVKLQVFGDVKVGDLVVIANKALATATIENSRSAGMAWRSGTLLLKMGSVTLLNGQQQPLRAWSAARGKDTGAPAEWSNAVLQSYGMALLLLPLAPLQHGNEAVLPRGTLLDAMISHDVLLPRDAIAVAQPRPAEHRQGPASVTFYYPDAGDGPRQDIWCGTLKIGKLVRGGKFTVTLPAGTYWLRLWNQKNSPIASLQAENGGEYFVRASWSSHPTELDKPAFREHIVITPHDIGEAESADTVTAKARDVRDPATLDLAQLQARPETKRN